MRLSTIILLLTIPVAGGGTVLALVLEKPDITTLLPPSIAPTPRFRPEDFVISENGEPALFSQLSKADQAWSPRAEPIPGGGTRYTYKRNTGDPPLSLIQLKALIRHPPSFRSEQQSIRLLLRQLSEIGVAVVLGPPRQRGAAGEWEPRQAVLRIRPDVPDQGSREFLRVLGHEAIHTVQSCRNGDVRAHPGLLGLPRRVSQPQRRHLTEPLYANASPLERALEEEAYANQNNVNLISNLITAHCRAQ